MEAIENTTVASSDIADYCRRWRVRRLSLFGSVLRNDFRSDSDIDVLVAFRPDAEWTLWDWIEMIDELKELFGRDVDLVEESGLRNPFRRQEILRTRKVVYKDDP